MGNKEKYDQIFSEVFEVNSDVLGSDFNFDTVETWDSVRQLSLVTAMEDEFDLMLDTEDILGFSSYDQGLIILKKYGISI